MEKTSIQGSEPIQRFRPRTPPGPEVFSEIIRAKARLREEASALTHQPAWNVGFASRCGNVRGRNEDHGVAFNHLGYQVLLLGDGLGGLKYGQLASFLAVETAAQVIMERLSRRLEVSDLQQISSEALWTAGHQLAFMGDKLNVSLAGLRTTLIIVIANNTQALLTYIGDGAVYHYKGPEDCESVLSAHKANPGTLNMLSASLGPTPQGKARSRVLTRAESDIIIVMTDGIADRIVDLDAPSLPPRFINDMIRQAIDRSGNLQATSEEAVDALTELEDESGFICDDNVSLGLIGNLKEPILPSSETAIEMTTAGESDGANSA